MKHIKVLLICLIAVGLVCPGCKKESPPSQEPNAPATSTQDQAATAEPNAPPTATKDPVAKETEFLSDPDVVTCELEKTPISQLDFKRGRLPSFVRRMQQQNKEDVKQGQITLANRPIKILLGERPEREFYLHDVEKGLGPLWWGSWSLHSYHKIDNEFFNEFIEFMLVEDGTKIAGRPYKGELGIIKVGKGGRDLEKVEFNGSVHQQGNVSAPIGTIKDYRTGPVPECEIPVGDYTAHIMDVIYDNLSITISNNYHTNAQGQSAGKEIVYGMQVRKDKPYVLDFSNEPMVVFDEPSMSKSSFSRGEEIKFAAVMIDPKLDIMIRRLNDTSVKVEKEYKDNDGKVIHTAKVPKSLDPKVVITRADGEVIAEGVMPFG
jgi:hypothetical protein